METMKKDEPKPCLYFELVKTFSKIYVFTNQTGFKSDPKYYNIEIKDIVSFLSRSNQLKMSAMSLFLQTKNINIFYFLIWNFVF